MNDTKLLAAVLLLASLVGVWGLYARHVDPDACVQVLVPACVDAVLREAVAR